MEVGVTVSELIEAINKLQEEIRCDGTGIAAHNIPSSVSFYVENSDFLDDIELVGIEASQLPGCGCWDGIRFRLKIVKDA